MLSDRVRQDRVAQVQACLATVVDPELDEPVTELDFITEVALLDHGEVRIGFRLPTYWCAANFAFLMADDMRRAVQALPWAQRVQVQLHDHMYADTINEGVAAGKGFQASFGEAAEGGLEALRRTFERKAFQRRQAALLEHLIEAGHAADTLVTLRLGGLSALVPDAAGEALVARYLQRRGVAGPGLRAFVDVEGRPIDADALAPYLRDVQRVGINAEFNGALCRGLLAARYAEAGHGADTHKPARDIAVQPIRIVRHPTPLAQH